jgi:endonuclease YncB( thermonuclease family)
VIALLVGGICLLAVLTFAAPGAAASSQTSAATVSYVVDGDTVALADGRRVRLVQIDATELGTGECYSRKAAAVLRSLLPAGTVVRLQADTNLDAVDRFGRLLRYVSRGRLNLNLELVRRGAATVWFYRSEQGRYAARLLEAAQAARDARRGMWGSCRVVWNPNGPATTAGGGSPPPPAENGGGGSGCHPSYTPCLPIVSDLDCADIDDSKKPIRVAGHDPYRLDGDGDGLGCES